MAAMSMKGSLVEQVDNLVGGKIELANLRQIVVATKVLVALTPVTDREEQQFVSSIQVRSNGLLTREQAQQVYYTLFGDPSKLYSGGSGLSKEDPVIISTDTTTKGIHAEYAWFRKHCGKKDVDWTLVMRSHGPFGARYLETFEIKVSDGSTKSVVFDITSFFGKP
jgi:hypothetical protein